MTTPRDGDQSGEVREFEVILRDDELYVVTHLGLTEVKLSDLEPNDVTSDNHESDGDAR